MTATTTERRFATGELPWAEKIDMAWLRPMFATKPDVDSMSADERATHNPACEQIATGFAAFLEGHNLTRNDEELENIIEDLKVADRPYELEDLLERFYDWADGNRIWLDQ